MSPGRTAAIVPAAGRGERLGAGVPKALHLLHGETLVAHAIRPLAAVVDVVVIVGPPDGLDALPHQVAGTCEVIVVPGGATRQASVRAGLSALPVDVDVVLVHDAARCLTPMSLVRSVIDAVRSGLPAVVPGLPVTDTMKHVHVAADSSDEIVGATVDRQALRVIQTPQGFDRALLDRAFAAASDDDAATDDAGLVERLGESVHVIPGHREALKITHPFDVLIAESILRSRGAAATPRPHGDSGGSDDGASDQDDSGGSDLDNEETLA